MGDRAGGARAKCSWLSALTILRLRVKVDNPVILSEQNGLGSSQANLSGVI